MKRRLYFIPFIFIGILLMANCAKKGRPSGGPRDTIPPIIVRSVPENFTTNFGETEIRIFFDEYIKLKDLGENLIISPPMKYAPIITPLNTSKMLRIRILDTLAENTTYSINFGKSIVDNNEENEFEFFKYVFSTGNYIDSLKVTGAVRDAKLRTAEFPVTVMLYEVNESFKDSTIYSEKPMYITATRDSSNTFEITNVKEGKYILIALKEKSNDYTFQPKTDKIGFLNEQITLPTDSTYNVTIFKEIPEYKVTRPSHLSKYHIVFGYEGDPKNLEITPLSELPNDFVSTTLRDMERDSLHYWFRPEITADSLLFQVRNEEQLDTVEVRMKNLFADSLIVQGYKLGTIIPRDTMSLKTTTPLVSIDNEMIGIMDKDSLNIPFTTRVHPENNLAQILFDRTEEQRYKVDLLPGALTDFYTNVSDSLSYSVESKSNSDYGTIPLTIDNVKAYPIIVELVSEKNIVMDSVMMTESAPMSFDYIIPGNYYIRIIFDSNSNGRWDTGSFLERLQPEEIVYYPNKIEVRANWTLNTNFILD
ncbi:MAG: Ig-like domain-containing protein [Bacteroidia bacterium]|nr:Ig-like domain-containing protein [Bacteroidia bacterium]NNF30404.1 Ig-like domain-containing protein [Flavobacteriaceae bacterium]MBT8275702.1 Ig-like domain-containing protein [Bacteroidia bacterium]NNJ82318.1 Ig-like domain-containing protein [Flavobacteriaceae bacterium]NNK54711.1 Ig-like domain-containing protein [Flavobacteriaceae bacterium]